MEFIVLGIIPLVFIVSYYVWKRYSEQAIQGFILFFIEDGNFFLNTKRPLRFPLNTIDYVCLRAHYLSKGTDYMSIQVMRKDGNHSARYIFDSSVYTKKKETLSNRASIDETLSSLAWELKTQSVPYKVIKEETYRFQ